MLKYQYLVCPPLAMSTCMTLRGMDSTNVCKTSGVILAQASVRCFQRSSKLVGLAGCSFLKRISHRCSMGFKSGLWAGQSRIRTRLESKKLHTRLALWQGALSCWKINVRRGPNNVLAEGSIQFLRTSRYWS